MFVCVCNPFNEQAVQGFLQQAAQEKKVIKIIDAYRACSGKDKPNCGTCSSVLRDMVGKHNDSLKSGNTGNDPAPQ